jgi:molybdopterin-guanine dinucleotide biosynthesis protein A
MKASGIILAGGKNLRLGTSKALVSIGGKTVIERIVGRLEPITDELIVVISGANHDLPPLPCVKQVTDVYPGRGPLGGIYTGLTACHNEYAIAVACDMPFLSTALLGHMLDLVAGHDAVVPRTKESLFEPLHAVYGRTCLPVIKKHMDIEDLSLRSFLAEINVRYTEEDECRRYDPDLMSFFNMNRQADLDLAQKIAELGQPGSIRGTSAPFI